MLKIIFSVMGKKKDGYNDELKGQSKENFKQVLEGFDLQKLKKIHKKAVRKGDFEISEIIKNILIERVIKEF